MRVDSLTTGVFRMEPGGYSAVWLRWTARRNATRICSFVAVCVIIGCLDLRYAISLCMLAAVTLPFFALLLWDRAMRAAYQSGGLRAQSVSVGRRSVTVTYADESPRASMQASLHGQVCETAGHLVLRLDGHAAPLIIPSGAVASVTTAPDRF